MNEWIGKVVLVFKHLFIYLGEGHSVLVQGFLISAATQVQNEWIYKV